jgi:hypothetical protein
MKGRTKCPKCNNDFIIEIPSGKERYKATCPNCKNKFYIKKSDECTDLEDKCIWEEHGEPRKTILSSIKPRTDKPIIIVLLFGIILILNFISFIFIQINQNLLLNNSFGSIYNINQNFNDTTMILSSFIIIILIISLIGLILSYNRNHLNIIVFCAFICIFSISFYFIASLLSLFTLILIYYSREEFINEKKVKIF